MKDIEDLQTVVNLVCNNLPPTEEMQLLVSKIELRIAELTEDLECNSL